MNNILNFGLFLTQREDMALEDFEYGIWFVYYFYGIVFFQTLYSSIYKLYISFSIHSTTAVYITMKLLKLQKYDIMVFIVMLLLSALH